MPDSSKAVFLSYASQDAEAVRRIADALRAAGIEVWFDQSELVGGDAWDTKIRGQIASCALFVPVISAATQARGEGYFRLEWKLAVDRSYLMAHDQPFLLPVVIDATPDAAARVPAEFRAVQWTLLPGGETPPAFCARVKKLLGGEGALISDRPSSDAGRMPALPPKVGRRGPAAAWIGLAAVVGLGIAGWVGLRPSPKADATMRPPTTTVVMPSQAQQLLAKILTIVEKDADADREEWLLAENLAGQLIKLDAANAEAWAAHAQIAIGRFLTLDLARDTSLAAALQRARQAVALRPESTDAKLALALAYTMEAKTRAEAEPILRTLAEQHPNDRRLWRALGTWAQLQGQNDEALTFYDRADALPGGDAASCRLKAGLLCGLVRYDEAERSIDRSLALRPGPAAHLLKLIFLATIRDDLPQACGLLEKLPGSYFLRDDVIHCAVQLWKWKREPQKAARLLTSWRDNYIGNSPKGIALGEAYQLMGRAEAAQQAWRSALALLEKQITEMVAGSDPLKYYAKARLLAHLGEKGAAEEAARLWEQSDPYAVGEQNKAALLVLLERNKEAVAALPKLPWTGLARSVVTLGRLPLGGGSYRYDPIWDPLRGDPQFEALVAAYRTMWGHGSGLKPATGSDPKSVAVLAFENKSDDPANELFSDGLSEDLIGALGRVPGLTVTGWTSSLFLKSKNLPTVEIGKQLGVAYVVRGSVWKSGDTVRITAQVSRAANDVVVWSSGPLDREVKDNFKVRDEIAGLIAEALSMKLGVTSATATTKVGIKPEAYRLYLEGREAWRQRDLVSNSRAELLFQRALELEPNFARALSGLADAWSNRAQQLNLIGAFQQRQSAELQRIGSAVARALELDPDLAEGHRSLAVLRWLEWKTTDGIAAVQQALKLNPNDASAHQMLGRLLMLDGRMDGALAALKRSHELDPLFSRVADNYSVGLLSAGRHEQALSLAEHALELQPGSAQACRFKVVALAELGRAAECRAAAARYFATGIDSSPEFVAYAFARIGDRDEARRLLASFSNTQREPARSATLLALGSRSECLEGIDAGNFTAQTLEVLLYWPIFDQVRDDPVMQKLFSTLGLNDAEARARAWRAANRPHSSKL